MHPRRNQGVVTLAGIAQCNRGDRSAAVALGRGRGAAASAGAQRVDLVAAHQEGLVGLTHRQPLQQAHPAAPADVDVGLTAARRQAVAQLAVAADDVDDAIAAGQPGEGEIALAVQAEVTAAGEAGARRHREAALADHQVRAAGLQAAREPQVAAADGQVQGSDHPGLSHAQRPLVAHNGITAGLQRRDLGHHQLQSIGGAADVGRSTEAHQGGGATLQVGPITVGIEQAATAAGQAQGAAGAADLAKADGAGGLQIQACGADQAGLAIHGEGAAVAPHQPAHQSTAVQQQGARLTLQIELLAGRCQAVELQRGAAGRDAAGTAQLQVTGATGEAEAVDDASHQIEPVAGGADAAGGQAQAAAAIDVGLVGAVDHTGQAIEQGAASGDAEPAAAELDPTQRNRATGNQAAVATRHQAGVGAEAQLTRHIHVGIQPCGDPFELQIAAIGLEPQVAVGGAEGLQAACAAAGLQQREGQIAARSLGVDGSGGADFEIAAGVGAANAAAGQEAEAGGAAAKADQGGLAGGGAINNGAARLQADRTAAAQQGRELQITAGVQAQVGCRFEAAAALQQAAGAHLQVGAASFDAASEDQITLQLAPAQGAAAGGRLERGAAAGADGDAGARAEPAFETGHGWRVEGKVTQGLAAADATGRRQGEGATPDQQGRGAIAAIDVQNRAAAGADQHRTVERLDAVEFDVAAGDQGDAALTTQQRLDGRVAVAAGALQDAAVGDDQPHRAGFDEAIELQIAAGDIEHQGTGGADATEGRIADADVTGAAAGGEGGNAAYSQIDVAITSGTELAGLHRQGAGGGDIGQLLAAGSEQGEPIADRPQALQADQLAAAGGGGADQLGEADAAIGVNADGACAAEAAAGRHRQAAATVDGHAAGRHRGQQRQVAAAAQVQCTANTEATGRAVAQVGAAAAVELEGGGTAAVEQQRGGIEPQWGAAGAQRRRRQTDAASAAGGDQAAGGGALQGEAHRLHRHTAGGAAGAGVQVGQGAVAARIEVEMGASAQAGAGSHGQPLAGAEGQVLGRVDLPQTCGHGVMQTQITGAAQPRQGRCHHVKIGTGEPDGQAAGIGLISGLAVAGPQGDGQVAGTRHQAHGPTAEDVGVFRATRVAEDTAGCDLHGPLQRHQAAEADGAAGLEADAG